MLHVSGQSSGQTFLTTVERWLVFDGRHDASFDWSTRSGIGQSESGWHDRRCPIIIHDGIQSAILDSENDDALFSEETAMEILVMVSAIAALSVILAFSILVRPGWIVSPNPANPAASKETHEEQLVRQINRISDEFPTEFWRRYRELRAKLEAEALIPDGPEHLELIQMTDQLEIRHADRLGLLSELAKLRKTSLAEVMKHSDVLAHFHG